MQAAQPEAAGQARSGPDGAAGDDQEDLLS